MMKGEVKQPLKESANLQWNNSFSQMTIEEKRRHRAAETNPRIRTKSAAYPMMVATAASHWKARMKTQPVQPDAQLATEPAPLPRRAATEPPAEPAPQPAEQPGSFLSWLSTQ